MTFLFCPFCGYGQGVNGTDVFTLGCESCDTLSDMEEWETMTKNVERERRRSRELNIPFKINGGENNMVDISKVYISGSFLNSQTVKSEGLVGKNLTIKNATLEQVGRPDNVQDKVVVSFDETDNRLVLNSTNAKIISEAYGTETDTWKKKQIILTLTKVSFQNALVDSIQISIPQ